MELDTLTVIRRKIYEKSAVREDARQARIDMGSRGAAAPA